MPQSTDAAIFIRKGTTQIVKKGKEVAKRSKGDLVGEMSLLLGDVPGVTIIAETPVEALIVEHAKLMEYLTSEPKECGPVFRTRASGSRSRFLGSRGTGSSSSECFHRRLPAALPAALLPMLSETSRLFSLPLALACSHVELPAAWSHHPRCHPQA